MHRAELPHSLLALFLLFQQLFLSADVAAVALCQHVLAHRLDGFTRDDLAADGRLNRNLEHLPRDDVFELLADGTPAPVRLVAVDDDGERVADFAVEQNIQLDQLALAVVLEFVVERGVSAAAALNLVKKVEDDFVERNVVIQLDARALVLHVKEDAAPILAQVHNRADAVLRREDFRVDERLFHHGNFANGRQRHRVVAHQHRAVGFGDTVDDARRGGDEVVEMLKYHVAVCDDEKSDLDGIVQSVQQYDVQGCFDIETYMDGNELLSELQMQKKSFDLLLLDIEMPSNGFQLAQSLIQMEKHPLVVFVTKRHEYAVQGYGIAFRYLVKPLDQTLFAAAMDAVLQELNSKHFTIEYDGVTMSLETSDIYFLESHGHKVLIHCKEQDLTLRMSIPEALEQLPKRCFVSPHKSYLVNMEHIVYATGTAVFLSSGHQLPISRRKRQEFNQIFNAYLGR